MVEWISVFVCGGAQDMGGGWGRGDWAWVVVLLGLGLVLFMVVVGSCESVWVVVGEVGWWVGGLVDGWLVGGWWVAGE